MYQLHFPPPFRPLRFCLAVHGNLRYPATQTKAISYFSRQAIFWAELRSSHLPGCDWLAGLENTLNCRQYCRQICGSSNTISLLRIFGNPNKMLDWRTNPNLILLTNIRVCPSILYSNAGFSAPCAARMVLHPLLLYMLLR